MELLKKLEEIYLPDVRYRNRANVNHDTGEIAEMGIETRHAQVENIRLNDNVPEQVRSDEQTAFKNLLDKVLKGRELTPGLSLSTIIAKLRNERAHGSSTISGQELVYVSACADLINEMYP